MSRRRTPAVHAAFLDLFCCALGAAILLVVMFATRLKSGQAIEEKTFVVVAFDLQERGMTIQEISDNSPIVSIRSNTHTDDHIEFQLDTVDNDSGSYQYRWLVVRSNGRPVSPENSNVPIETIYLVITHVREDLMLAVKQAEAYTGASTTIFVNGKTQRLEDGHTTTPIEIERL